MRNILVVLCLVSTQAFAGTFSSIRWDNVFKEYGRAEWSIQKYNPRKTNWRGQFALMLKAHSSESCGKGEVFGGATNSIKELGGRFYEEHNAAALLNKLLKAGRIHYAIHAYDGDGDYSEYCSTSSFRFYSKDGEVLDIYFDFNT